MISDLAIWWRNLGAWYFELYYPRGSYYGVKISRGNYSTCWDMRFWRYGFVVIHFK